mmetsp:Transcript_13115/g.31060  ORF Transcript_13115/g.31060 Transcript_13115/m.31060 type:complete len:104 (+) Transcript_13115:198-509(+)
MEECGSDALRVVKRQDTCYDLGSIHLVLNGGVLDLTKYDYFVYLNCGVVGPFWWDNAVSWTTFFTSLLNDQVKMCRQLKKPEWIPGSHSKHGLCPRPKRTGNC